MAGPIEALKETRWWKPALKKYASHLVATKNQKCPDVRARFVEFAADILNTPVHLRDELLKIDALEHEPPRVRYRQYDMPIAAEVKIGTVTKKKKGAKNVDIRTGRRNARSSEALQMRQRNHLRQNKSR